MVENVPEKIRGGFSVNIVWKSFFLLLLGGAVVSSGYFYARYRQVLTEASKSDTNIILETIGKSIELPEGEAPTIATVTDKTKLSGQSFFRKAENGDKVLLYPEARKAFLYRPSTKKVVDMTIINIDSKTAPSLSPAETGEVAGTTNEQVLEEHTSLPEEVSKIAEIVVSNGTEKRGLAKQYGGELAMKYGSELSVKEEVIAEGVYEKTIVVDVSGAFSELAKKLATEYAAEVVPLPDGEPKPEADILVILGKDRL